MENHGVVENTEETWRSMAKEVFVKSEKFWNELHKNIDYYMIDITNKLISVGMFEKKMVKYALMERKEFFSAKLIFISLYSNGSIFTDTLEDQWYYENFLPLFIKIAELSPSKKISLKWVLDLNPCEEIKFSNYNECNQDNQWIEYNNDLFHSLGPLASLYRNHPDLFVNDITQDQSIMMHFLVRWDHYCI
uniref:Uncharacterized protein n=1 Tax=Pithovirus LCPAC403 TaxID=2506596 RepID=A0A481ZC40_9VIRU|nr:MAG: hypothetical protein LCPAC403_01890 [Pithovirus LCPAC403]